MIEQVPYWIALLFILTTFAAVLFFYKATQRSGITLLVLLLWMALQAVLGISGFYANTSATPPHFPLMPIPPVIVLVLLFVTKRGRNFIDSLDPKALTWLHVVRVPVEITLLLLFLHNFVPQEMTFEGRNFDIVSGITAPVVAWLAYKRKSLSRGAILAWNFICLALLFNIVIHAIFALPFPFQRIGFEQPNVAVLYFPFNWLPSVVVPLVLLSHLVVIRQTLRAKKSVLPKS
jgi:hypothetical protein